MARKLVSDKWPSNVGLSIEKGGATESETDKMLKLRQLDIEEKKIASKRIYTAIWILIIVLLIGTGVYGLAIENLGLGVPCLVFGLGVGVGGLEFLGVKALINYVRNNRKQNNMTVSDGSYNVSSHDEETESDESVTYEYCPRCQANLTLQKGYSNELPYWICKGCGEMLINPKIDSDVSWICDGCGTMLNIQPGFNEDCGEWTCTECGFVNKIDSSELYVSEDEYQAAMKNPYRGLSDTQMLELSAYREIECVDERSDIILVEDPETGKKYIKKLLTIYNKSVYEYLKENPISHMPKIIALYESSNCLIVIEEYIEGWTIAELIKKGPLSRKRAVAISIDICRILDDIHNLPKPIIHRDIKPSNVIITSQDEVFLLDMNVAKWYEPGKTDDTRHMGTENYAAPEQVGYGLSASSAKSDIYAVGILLNVMLTGKYPKEQRPSDDIWSVIERCICLESKDRYTAKELINKLESM